VGGEGGGGGEMRWRRDGKRRDKQIVEIKTKKQTQKKKIGQAKEW
jgi:hypothetical protein